MRKHKFRLVCSIVVMVALQVGSDPAANAGPWLSSFFGEGSSAGSSSLVLKAGKQKCQRVFVCDYFTPATSCSAPPCCKKGHWEKNCEKKPKGPSTPSKTSDPSPMNHSCYPVCKATIPLRSTSVFFAKRSTRTLSRSI